jgi:hypothetical protein
LGNWNLIVKMEKRILDDYKNIRNLKNYINQLQKIKTLKNKNLNTINKSIRNSVKANQTKPTKLNLISDCKYKTAIGKKELKLNFQNTHVQEP